jgi:hypothetical protein
VKECLLPSSHLLSELPTFLTTHSSRGQPHSSAPLALIGTTRLADVAHLAQLQRFNEDGCKAEGVEGSEVFRELVNCRHPPHRHSFVAVPFLFIPNYHMKTKGGIRGGRCYCRLYVDSQTRLANGVKITNRICCGGSSGKTESQKRC